MATTVKQPTPNPTKKLSAAVIAVAIMEISRVLTTKLWPGTFDPAFWAAMSPIVVFVVGWFVKDDYAPMDPNPEPDFETGDPS